MVTVDVPDCGAHVVTKNRYRLEGFVDGEARGYVTDEARIRQYARSAKKLRPLFEKWQPDVFSDTGIPIVVNGENTRWSFKDYHESRSFLCESMIWYFASLCVFPVIDFHEGDMYGYLESVDGVAVNIAVSMHIEQMSALTMYSPFGYWFLMGEEGYGQLDERPLLTRRGVAVDEDGLLVEALAYGVASRLKEVEDKGLDNFQVNGGAW